MSDYYTDANLLAHYVLDHDCECENPPSERVREAARNTWKIAAVIAAKLALADAVMGWLKMENSIDVGKAVKGVLDADAAMEEGK